MSFTKLFIKLFSVTTFIPILLAGCNSKPDPLSKLTPYEKAVYLLYSQPVENISPQALNPIFELAGNHTDLKRQIVLQELKGKVISWDLEIYEVRKINADTVRIQTSTGRVFGSDPFSKFSRGFLEGAKGRVNQNVGTFIELTVPPDQWGIVANVKTGDWIKIRGRLTGETTMRNIEISPAVIDTPVADNVFRNIQAFLAAETKSTLPSTLTFDTIAGKLTRKEVNTPGGGFVELWLDGKQIHRISNLVVDMKLAKTIDGFQYFIYDTGYGAQCNQYEALVVTKTGTRIVELGCYRDKDVFEALHTNKWDIRFEERNIEKNCSVFTGQLPNKELLKTAYYLSHREYESDRDQDAIRQFLGYKNLNIAQTEKFIVVGCSVNNKYHAYKLYDSASKERFLFILK